MKVWLLENEQARWFEFEEPHDMPSDVIVTMLTETEQPAQQEPAATVRTWHKNGVQHAELDNWGLALALLPDGKHDLYTSQPQQEQGDSICQEDDGCPTELAVLQRFWRGQPIPDEHYPAWFVRAYQQKPVSIKEKV